MAEYCVIGGAGYPGMRLVTTLAGSGVHVKVFDVIRPGCTLPANVTFVQGDVVHYDSVKSACCGTDCVFLMASHGMSGREQLNRRLIENVNVVGTKNVIRACQGEGVSRLIYTSTYNVVFGGQEIHDGDESLPYLSLDKHVDHYSRTKAIAEMKILSANNSAAGDQVLRTCAIRLAGVYGPGEQRHLPRIVSYIRSGAFAFTYGLRESLVDFLHVDNMVQVHILAANALTAKRNYIAAGKSYFVSDCLPVNNFLFFKPLVEGLGYKFPQLQIPFHVVYFFAFIMEILHRIIGRLWNFQPVLTRAEVFKTGVTHYFNISRARTELGYCPLVQNDMDGVLEWYLERGYHRDANQNKRCNLHISQLFFLLILLMFLFSWLPVAG